MLDHEKTFNTLVELVHTWFNNGCKEVDDNNFMATYFIKTFTSLEDQIAAWETTTPDKPFPVPTGLINQFIKERNQNGPNYPDADFVGFSNALSALQDLAERYGWKQGDKLDLLHVRLLLEVADFRW